ncbi:MAG: GDP-mannose 4,6-dehydratase [Candidatus Curtissbacteria bacterium]|nr:GDP-mannose 4,6-dehydratase [Candidatus Curtissbacteria bacterium]
MKKALITGIAGFAGSHLAELLLSEKFDVYGFYHPQHSTENLRSIKDSINLIDCDILKAKSTQEKVLKINPDFVFHLAAFSSPPKSFENPAETLNNNIVGQINLLEALVKIKSKAKILIIGSSDEYGIVEEKYLPVNEETPLAPLSPYAVSKIAQDMLGLQYFLHNKLNIVRIRPFNHIGPRQSLDFVVPSFASQIAQVEKKGKGVMKVGNLESSKDFTDVRDMVSAYLLALEKGKVGEVYNIGSGKAVKIKEILDILISLSTATIEVKQEKSRVRSTDFKTVYADYSKFKKDTGWQPRTPLLKTLSDTIEYERIKLEARNSKSETNPNV